MTWKEHFDECPECGGLVVDTREKIKEDGHYTIYIHPGMKAVHPSFGNTALVHTNVCRVRRDLTDDERQQLIDREFSRGPF